MTTIEQITDRWNYIQGGFTYINSNNESNGTDNTVQLSANELLGFISKLPDTQATAKASIIDVLIPDAEPAMFEGLLNHSSSCWNVTTLTCRRPPRHRSTANLVRWPSHCSIVTWPPGVAPKVRFPI